MADSAKKDEPVVDASVKDGKKEEEKPPVVEEVITIEDGKSATGLARADSASPAVRCRP